MKQDKIIEMAWEAGMEFVTTNSYSTRNKNVTHLYQNMYGIEKMERFFDLAFAAGAAHERNRHAWTQDHWTEYEHAIAAAEREACAQVCDGFNPDYIGAATCAAAIRARNTK